MKLKSHRVYEEENDHCKSLNLTRHEAFTQRKKGKKQSLFIDTAKRAEYVSTGSNY